MVNTKVRFPNVSRFPRTEVAYSTVPFPEGEWDGELPLVLKDDQGNKLDCVIEPFGERWPDNTVRYARLLSRLTIPQHSTVVCDLVDDLPEHTDRFQFAPEVLGGAGANSPALGIRTADGWQWTQFSTHLTLLENNRLRRVIQSRHRMGDFVVDMKYYIMSKQQLVKFELSITGSNPDVLDYTYPIEEIRLKVQGNTLFNIRGAAKRGVETVIPYSDMRLMDQDFFGDGQKQTWYGEIMPSIDLSNVASVANGLAAIDAPLYGMSLDWEQSKAYASFGVLQDPHNNNEAWNKVTETYHMLNGFMKLPGNPWDDYLLGVSKTPGQTGAQRDFGCIEGGEVLHNSAAELLDVYLFMATEESKRPGHYFESDATPVRSANHPNWKVWNGRTHSHTVVSPDRLGKNDPAPDPITSHHGWFGKDWQHHSSNLLSMAALLTGSYMLADEVDTEMELYLGGFTLPSEYPGWSTAGIRAPRGFGRTHHAMCNHFLMTGRQEVKEHMITRFHEVANAQWDGATRSPVRNWGHVLDNRVLNGQFHGWVPWNETLGFVGIVALYNVTKDPIVRDLMIAWGQTIVKYGWRASDKKLGGGIKWNNDGSPLTPAEYQNPELFEVAGGGLQLWGTPAIKVIAEHSELFGQEAAEMAATYLTHARTNYLLGNNEAFPEYTRWEALDIR